MWSILNPRVPMSRHRGRWSLNVSHGYACIHRPSLLTNSLLSRRFRPTWSLPGDITSSPIASASSRTCSGWRFALSTMPANVAPTRTLALLLATILRPSRTSSRCEHCAYIHPLSSFVVYHLYPCTVLILYSFVVPIFCIFLDVALIL